MDWCPNPEYFPWLIVAPILWFIGLLAFHIVTGASDEKPCGACGELDFVYICGTCGRSDDES